MSRAPSFGLIDRGWGLPGTVLPRHSEQREESLCAGRWQKEGFLAGESGVLYAGMTNNLVRRVREHKEKQIAGFTQKYNVTKLVWCEAHGRATNAIAREKQIKGWSRAKKVALIEGMSPQWKDMSEGMR